MTVAARVDERPIKVLRRRLESIRRRRAARRETYEFTMKRLEARLLSREAEVDDDD